MTQPHPSQRTLICSWSAFLAIGLLYFFGLAAFTTDHSEPARPFVEVWQRVRFGDVFSEYIRPIHWITPAVGLVLLLAYSFTRPRWIRVSLIFVAVVGPLFFEYGLNNIGLWALSAPLAPYFTCISLFGSQDGEFYSEGSLMLAAMGWWAILWLMLAFRETIIWRHERHTA